ncbi:hypothetical protein Hbl1158_07385 [Halobaculum sp. CBA1158]|uniref:DUF7285 family protein n=1 Tax=Halobaculum sp. CBA1158 TaxID=2904243 RepID=UPI001F41FF28|nr:hypothetical protein [Halobaculum sp. CBA1158]UIP01161.1 hypothetical protein Hbl1158_07385 [Halobaculum sp. CBA1158]
MSRSSCSRERALAEPTAALASVLAISLGIAAYATVLGGVGASGSPAADPALERAADAVTVGGVADPDRLPGALAAAAGVESDDAGVTVSLSAGGRNWSAGSPPATLERDGAAEPVTSATRRLGVALGPGRVRPGRLRVRVWR